MSDQISIEGICDKIIYQNPQNGYCVFRLSTQKGEQVCCGISVNIQEKSHLKVKGNLEENKYGLQLVCDEIIPILPKDKKGILQYLSSGIIPGIREAFAKKLVDFAGDKLFSILDKDPKALYNIKGIGKKRIDTLIAHWNNNQALHEVMMYAQKVGIGPKRTLKIHQHYKDQTLHILQTNPYQVYQDIDGIGFKLADNIALQSGIEKNNMYRLSAAAQYLLEQAMQSGHCYLPKDVLLEKLSQLLGFSPQYPIEQICQQDLFFQTNDNVYLQNIYHAERQVEKTILQLSKNPSVWSHSSLAQLEKILHQSTLSNAQKSAILTILNSKVGIITGGPGVGKTTLTKELVKLARHAKLQIALCAPTGRAAKKLSASTGIEAKTIHRLLKMDPIEKKFQHNAKNPLKADIVLVDESSMLDVFLTNHLLQAIDPLSNLILIGDIDQLPAVGPGNILKDMIALFPSETAHLTEIFRQAKHSKIIMNAHQVNSGKMLIPNSEELSDFYMISQNEPEKILDNIKHLILNRIPHRFKLHSLEDIQILCPMRRGSLGTQNINTFLQSLLNPSKKTILKFREKDKVIQLKNNYDKDIFNGDVGYVQSIDETHSELTVNFGDTLVSYLFSELDELELAYAITIHKSQGSEYPCVIIPIAMQHYTLLERNLIYTAITRGKQLVILIGETKAISMAIRNQKSKKRYTHLNIE